MNALNDLSTEVRFRERMRGYDFEEVDSYVKAVSRAVANGKDQISDLQQRLAQTETHSGNGDGLNETREMLLRTLVLAQRTADTAISEARTEARSITDSARERAAKTVAEAEAAANERLRSSEERAVRTVAEAEENCQLILSEAKRTAAAELAVERSRKIQEIEALEAARADLEAATAAIGARLDSERSQLRSLAASFQSFVEQFEPVTDPGDSTGGPAGPGGSDQGMEIDGSAMPGAGQLLAEPEDEAGHGSQVPAIGFSLDPGDEAAAAEHDPGNEAAAAEQAGGTASAEQAALTDDTASAEQAAKTDDAAAEHDPGNEAAASAEQATDDAAVEEALAGTLATDTLPGLPPVEWAGEDAGPAGAASPSAYPAGPVGAGQAHQASADPHRCADTVAAPATHSADTRSPELFDIEAEEDDEFIEQLRQVVSSDAPLPRADAAMAAFFDHDEGTGRGGRLGPRA
ncbi:MAG: DivIVA domain-containing protein [Acidimicrobiaceae bacterium]|nr:DivIVA domain-containing protein [Acidimicrobiaceae bacterium]